VTGTSTVVLVSPGAKVAVPVEAAKSAGEAAEPSVVA
jgi:hypothetical protein